MEKCQLTYKADQSGTKGSTGWTTQKLGVSGLGGVFNHCFTPEPLN